MFNTQIRMLRPLLPASKPAWPLLGATLWIAALILVWWLGPELELKGARPLGPLWGRLLFSLSWLWLLLGIFTWHGWRSMRRLKADPPHDGMPMQGTEEQRRVDRQGRFLDRWVQVLDAHLGLSAAQGLPWYLVLGMPGSGKSSLIRRGNPANRLDPLLDSELRELAQGQSVACWLGEQAVVLDPAGEILSPSDLGHEQCWRHLLDWLGERRPSQPLNGLMLTLDLAWLSGASVAERRGCAELMRTRLREVSATLDCRLPLYVTFTKLDLLRGFDLVYGQLGTEARTALLGVTFSPDASQWQQELAQFWDKWLESLNDGLPGMLLARLDATQRHGLFSFVRQLAGLRERVMMLLEETLAQEGREPLLVRGVYVGSVCQQGVPFDAFAQAASRRYQLPEPIHPALRGESTTYFVCRLFSSVLFPEAHLAGERQGFGRARRRRMLIGAGCLLLCSAILLGGWHYFYRLNEAADQQVLSKAQAFIQSPAPTGEQGFGVSQLPRLNLIREATLVFGDYRERAPRLADLGLYQGDEIGPFVEGSYLRLLNQRFLPSQMQGLLADLEQAPAGSEEKLSILRVMRMLDDASGRDKALVAQFMADRWQRAFPNQGAVQKQLMTHLLYALEHTDWHGARLAGDPTAIVAFEPFKEPVYGAQRELGRLPMAQRIYQSLVVKASEVLAPALDVRDEVGSTFDTVFTLRQESASLVPRLLTYPGFSDFFLKQDESLITLSAMDAWVLGQHDSSELSEADRKEIHRRLGDRYVSDYVNRWQTLLASLDVQTLSSPEQALDVLAAITGSEQPFWRLLAALDDNTRIRKLSEREGDPAQAINARIGRPFMSTHAALSGHGEQGPLMQEINRKLTELKHSLELIVNASDPGQAALKAVEQRLSNRYADPVFALQQYAQSLPNPLDRWVGQLAGQSAHLVAGLAIASLNQVWQDEVLMPFNSQLAGRYPFDPGSSKDASLADLEHFFAPGGTLDSFYQANLKPMMEGGLITEALGSPLQSELLKQLDRAARIRAIFFGQQGNLEVQFALEPISLSNNKRRSVLNLDGQLLEYAHGRRTKVPLIWPNNMREGSESKITLVSAERDHSPRSEGFAGPWAMFRLMGKGEQTRVDETTFDVRFPLDDGAMSYRVYADGAQSPFGGGLFSQFRLPETLY